MLKTLLLFGFLFYSAAAIRAQDTFSVVAVDPVTGEVGSAGASCVDLNAFGLPAGFLGELFPGVGAINTQASYLAANQTNARLRMQAGDTPAQIIAWLQANDVQNNPAVRQYGVVGFVNGSPQAAAHTGVNTLNFKGHRTGATYSIQGNILLGPQILDSMEARFLNTPGTLAHKLMATLQGANVVGADSRCTGNGTSSLFAFLKVSKPTDAFGSPSLNLGIITASNAQIEPIDSLQQVYNQWLATLGSPSAISRPGISVWPNPARAEVRLTGAKGPIRNVEIFTLLGQQIKAVTAASGLTAIDIRPLASGAYLLRATDEKGNTYQQMFVKE